MPVATSAKPQHQRNPKQPKKDDGKNLTASINGEQTKKSAANEIGNATVTNGESAETDVVATDDVMTPMQKTVEMVEKKARNLEKRKTRLLQYMADEKSGAVTLTAEQKDACSRIGEVEKQLELTDELRKGMQQHIHDQTRESKKLQQGEVECIRELLRYQNLLNLLDKQEVVREAFTNGTDDAIKLTNLEMHQLMDTLAVICPLRVEGETSDAWNQRLDKSAKRTHNLLIGNQKGPWIITDCSGEYMKALLDRVLACDFVRTERALSVVSSAAKVMGTDTTNSEVHSSKESLPQPPLATISQDVKAPDVPITPVGSGGLVTFISNGNMIAPLLTNDQTTAVLLDANHTPPVTFIGDPVMPPQTVEVVGGIGMSYNPNFASLPTTDVLNFTAPSYSYSGAAPHVNDASHTLPLNPPSPIPLPGEQATKALDPNAPPFISSVGNSPPQSIAGTDTQKKAPTRKAAGGSNDVRIDAGTVNPEGRSGNNYRRGGGRSNNGYRGGHPGGGYGGSSNYRNGGYRGRNNYYGGGDGHHQFRGGSGYGTSKPQN